MVGQSKEHRDTERGYVMIEWSHDAACYVWSCEWGCSGFDCESRDEAVQAYLSHVCVGQKAII